MNFGPGAPVYSGVQQALMASSSNPLAKLGEGLPSNAHALGFLYRRLLAKFPRLQPALALHTVHPTHCLAARKLPVLLQAACQAHVLCVLLEKTCSPSMEG